MGIGKLKVMTFKFITGKLYTRQTRPHLVPCGIRLTNHLPEVLRADSINSPLLKTIYGV